MRRGYHYPSSIKESFRCWPSTLIHVINIHPRADQEVDDRVHPLFSALESPKSLVAKTAFKLCLGDSDTRTYLRQHLLGKEVLALTIN